MGSEWQTITVGEFAPFTYGKGLPEKSRNHSGKWPVFGSNGVVGFHDKPLTDVPTVVIGRKGSVGAVHFSQTGCWPIDTTFYVTGKNLILTRFRYYVLKSLGLEHMNSDSAVPGLNRDAAHAISLDVPQSEIEQADISKVLGIFDDRIDHNRALAAKLEAIVRRLFKSWFVDFDPVRAKAAGEKPAGLADDIAALFPDRFEDSELGEIPEGWQQTTLAAIASLNPETWTTRKHPDEIDYLDLSNVKDGVIEAPTKYSWDDAPSRARRVLQQGDAIIGTARPGNRSFALIDVVGFTGSTGFAVLRPLSDVNREFLYIAATNDDAIERLAHLADGA